MSYYDDFSKKKMTKRDHLREDAKKGEDETSFRRGMKKNTLSRGQQVDKVHARITNNAEKSNTKTAVNNRPSAQKSPKKPVEQLDISDISREPENLLTGRNPIREAIKTGRDIEKLLVAKGDLSGTAREIIAMAREARIPVQMVERTRLDEITRNHQGMIAYASAYQYADVDDMLKDAQQKGEPPFLVILDGVTDPHNLGAVIRTAAAVGAHGVIVPERRAVGLTPAAVKAAAGSIEHIKVARVTNIVKEIGELKKHGIWFYAADAAGKSFREIDFSGPCALVIGSEGDGISRLVTENCDYLVSIPMKNPDIESLNASVAAGILMYAVASNR